LVTTRPQRPAPSDPPIAASRTSGPTAMPAEPLVRVLDPHFCSRLTACRASGTGHGAQNAGSGACAGGRGPPRRPSFCARGRLHRRPVLRERGTLPGMECAIAADTRARSDVLCPRRDDRWVWHRAESYGATSHGVAVVAAGRHAVATRRRVSCRLRPLNRGSVSQGIPSPRCNRSCCVRYVKGMTVLGTANCSTGDRQLPRHNSQP